MRRKNSHSYPVTIARDFKEFYEVPTSKGEPAIVVGGHAANLWALHYLRKEPELLQYAPFTSKDLDLVGDSTTAIHLARMVNEPAERAPRSEPTPVIYRIKRLFPDEPDRQNSTLEVLDHLAGVPNRELRDSTLIIYSKELDTRVRLPSPITCLKGQTRNLVRIPQDNRQDLKKVQMLILCCRGFLREQLALAEQGKMTAGNVATTFATLESWVCSRTAQIAASRHQLDWSEAFPIKDLKKTSIAALHHIPEWLTSLPGAYRRANGHAARNGHRNGKSHLDTNGQEHAYDAIVPLPINGLGYGG
jgi:hypothetical protein